MAKTSSNGTQVLNYAIVIAILFLVCLVVYGNRFHRSLEQDTPDSLGAAPLTTHNATEGATRISVTDAPHPPPPAARSGMAPEFPRNKPDNVTGSLDDPGEVRHALANQSRQLRAETSSQGFLPEQKRPLALSHDEIAELEQSGNMIY